MANAWVHEALYGPIDFGDITTGNFNIGSGNSGGTTTVGEVKVDIGHDVSFGSGLALAQEAVYCPPPPPPPSLDFGDITTGDFNIGSGNSGGTTTVGPVTVDIGHDVSFG